MAVGEGRSGWREQARWKAAECGRRVAGESDDDLPLWRMVCRTGSHSLPLHCSLPSFAHPFSLRVQCGERRERGCKEERRTHSRAGCPSLCLAFPRPLSQHNNTTHSASSTVGTHMQIGTRCRQGVPRHAAHRKQFIVTARSVSQRVRSTRRLPLCTGWARVHHHLSTFSPRHFCNHLISTHTCDCAVSRAAFDPLDVTHSLHSVSTSPSHAVLHELRLARWRRQPLLRLLRHSRLLCRSRRRVLQRRCCCACVLCSHLESGRPGPVEQQGHGLASIHFPLRSELRRVAGTDGEGAGGAAERNQRAVRPTGRERLRFSIPRSGVWTNRGVSGLL